MRIFILNVILPSFFVELKYVLIALIFVVLIETLIVKYFFNQKFRHLFEVLLFANISTTLIGYFLQAVARLILTFVLTIESDNPYLKGFSGNIGIISEWNADVNLSIFISILTSTLICLSLSIYFERRIVLNRFEGDVPVDKVRKGVFYANTASYFLLFFWIYLNYRFR